MDEVIGSNLVSALHSVHLVLLNLDTFEKTVILALLGYIWEQRGLLSEGAFVREGFCHPTEKNYSRPRHRYKYSYSVDWPRILQISLFLKSFLCFTGYWIEGLNLIFYQKIMMGLNWKLWCPEGSKSQPRFLLTILLLKKCAKKNVITSGHLDERISQEGLILIREP